MSKKGFTLVELLAVIVILAVILAIAIPSVTNIISNSRLNSFNASSDMLERAVRAYMGANNITVASGTISYILYTDMKNAGYIGKTSDPISNNECTHSGVFVSNTGGIYTYKGALVCDNYMDIDAYNLAINGDFSNSSSSDWSSAYGTNSIVNGVLRNTANGGSNYSVAYQLIPAIIHTNEKYYVSLSARTLAAANQLTVEIQNQAGNTLSQGGYYGANSIANNWYKISLLASVQSTYDGTQLRTARLAQSYADAATANGKIMELDNVVTLNLTAMYGAGNEPTQTQMDKIITNMGK